ncbi:alpha/beta hydrolase family protein [Allorhizocola rhizosphaerae]|uniref:alpha/beta hydrolase family protein n=1 Tax=Allorhizocola rhizosphaerae TaxID=1872709 RepID=UPI000E3D25D8|nr:hypothetical protein [Allorhizocola rhizosphaerae]
MSVHVVDRDRFDPFAPGRPRELMLQLWYPANPQRDQTFAPCMPPKAAESFGLQPECMTHAYQSAPVARQRDPLFGVIPVPWMKRNYPVVLYSHAYSSSRGFGTVLIEELASRGYIVVAVDHPYDAGAVEFPGGRVVTYQPEEPPSLGPPDLAWLDEANKRGLPVRVADMRFVVDSLAEMNEGKSSVEGLPSGLAGAMNLDRIGFFGHSLGGTTVAQAMLEDNRIKAGLSLDGAMPPAVRASGLDNPILFIASEQPDPYRAIESSWQVTNQRGWHRGLRMTGTGHNSFTDLIVICTQMECGQGMESTLGSVNAGRAVAVQRAYLMTFFDGQLKGRDLGLLNRPSQRYPEIVFLN